MCVKDSLESAETIAQMIAKVDMLPPMLLALGGQHSAQRFHVAE